jgi:hypothetical protein
VTQVLGVLAKNPLLFFPLNFGVYMRTRKIHIKQALELYRNANYDRNNYVRYRIWSIMGYLWRRR